MGVVRYFSVTFTLFENVKSFIQSTDKKHRAICASLKNQHGIFKPTKKTSEENDSGHS